TNFPIVELGEISFYRNGVRLNNEITATNTGGDNPANSGPAALVDGNPSTVWLDRNGAPSTNETPSTVELDFGVPVSFDSYTFTTGADPGYTGRDPRKWIVSASTNRTDWVNVGFENANDLPEERSVESDWFGVNRNLFWDAPFTDASARIIRPLDRLATELAQAEMPDELQPSHPDKVDVSGSRWYFKDLGGSIGKRFYYDSLAGELVFRGRLNDLESGEPDLTRQPVQPYVLEPNFLTEETKELLIGLDSTNNSEWEEAIDELYEAATTEFTTGTEFGLGVVPATSRTDIVDIPFYDEDDLVTPATNGIGNVVPLSSLGIGSALVATPHFLEEDIDVPVYVTLAENNHPQASGAVALHIIKLAQDRYRGSINVITPRDAFDDRIELKHTGDFGGNTAEIYYQWYVRDVSPLAEAGTPDGAYSDNWQVYAQGLGLNSIVFEGRPDITLADKFFFVRYGGLEELSEANEENVVTNGLVSDSSWRNVLPDDPEPEWGFAPLYEVPFQWAGAANSPQLQADGSKRYLPQLVMGWVKRVLDAINLYEARYSATFTGDAPATYASMLQQAGGPYIGPVALNAEKDNIENTGLIALYETVLQRALDLTSTPGSSNMGTDQALLLAATRLSFLYQLLGSEAFSDAQNFVVPQSADASTPLPTDAFAFKNMVANPLQEELALLRGTDFLKSYPAFNRLFWNYVKADGEAYYNANYNIHDMDNNGLIDEADAAILYPMGHGDAWGHYLSATKMHYALLKRPGFQWGARSELYSLLQNVLPVDYLDEKTFATIAGDKVRAGAAILKSTYRDAYVSDPAGQWQGYEDTAQPARAWGVSEWSRRVGQGAWFDWLAVNAVTPAPSTNQLEGLDRIDRNTTAAEIGSVAAGLAEMQQLVNHANRGLNPLGLDSDAMAFQADPFYNGISWVSHPPFKQALDKALKAIETARGFYESASQADQQLRRIANDTRALQEQAILQDLEYRNRLIGLYGTPYEGTIGPGKIYAEGYNGPDLLTYMYVKYSSYNDIAPTNATFLYQSLVEDINNQANPMDFQVGIEQAWTFEPESMSDVLANFYLDGSSSDGLILAKPGEDVNPDDVNVIYTRLPYETTSDYAFQAPHEWGRRASPGAIQDAIDEMLAAEIELELGRVEQNVYLNKVKMLAYSTLLKLESVQQSYNIAEAYAVTKLSLEASKMAIEKVIAIGSGSIDTGGGYMLPYDKPASEGASYDGGVGQQSFDDIEVSEEAVPKSIGAFNGMDLLSAVRAALLQAGNVKTKIQEKYLRIWEGIATALEFSLTTAEVLKEAGGEAISAYNEYVASLHELGEALNEVWTGQNAPLAGKIRELEAKGERVRAIVAEAERLVQERAALNMQIAAKAQRNRYA
ncbi:MAG: discoidin domain-containing protein, partial [Kiritimatiellia bacterium]